MRITLNQRPEAITEARDAAKLSKTALAKAVGRSLSLISEIEGGTRNAQPDLLAKMATVLGVPVEQLRRKVPGEPGGGQTTPPADVDVRALRDQERAVADDLPELRPVAGDA